MDNAFCISLISRTMGNYYLIRSENIKYLQTDMKFKAESNQSSDNAISLVFLMFSL